MNAGFHALGIDGRRTSGDAALSSCVRVRRVGGERSGKDARAAFVRGWKGVRYPKS